MGTRHSQTVIDKDGNLKLRQYGQWDGYPEGQGLDILKFLLFGNLEKYQKNLDNVKNITDEQAKEIEKDPDWPRNHMYLSRDCGSRIHKMIEMNKAPLTSIIDKFDVQQEGIYKIDFQKRKFTSQFHDTKKIYSLDKLPTIEQYLKDMGVEQDRIDSALKYEKQFEKLKKIKTLEQCLKTVNKFMKDRRIEKSEIESIRLNTWSDDPRFNCSITFKAGGYDRASFDIPTITLAKAVMDTLSKEMIKLKVKS